MTMNPVVAYSSLFAIKGMIVVNFLAWALSCVDCHDGYVCDFCRSRKFKGRTARAANTVST
jgi:hypothetical protein